MRIIDSKNLQLPKHFNGSFSGLDRLSLDCKNVSLVSVKDLANNKFGVEVKEIDGPEAKTGYVRFGPDASENFVTEVYMIFENSIGQKIADIYNLSVPENIK